MSLCVCLVVVLPCRFRDLCFCPLQTILVLTDGCLLPFTDASSTDQWVPLQRALPPDGVIDTGMCHHLTDAPHIMEFPVAHLRLLHASVVLRTAL